MSIPFNELSQEEQDQYANKPLPEEFHGVERAIKELAEKKDALFEKRVERVLVKHGLIMPNGKP